MFVELRFSDVATFIASGNVLFSTRATDSGKLESLIAKHLAASLGYEVDTFVRTVEEVTKVASAKVLPVHSQDGIIVHVAFLQRPLPKEIARKLMAVRTATDTFRVIGREYYWLYRGLRTSESKVWTLPEVRALRLPTSTMRNLTSVRKLIAKHLA